MTTSESYNYKDTEKDLTNKPANTHLIIELDSDEFYFVKITTEVELYHYNVSTGVETQIDIDPSNSSGDNKSRDHKIQALWHDKTNSIIWGLDCDNDGTADDFDVWKLDYSSSKTAPTVTEVGTSTGADANSVYAHDIFKIGSDTFVINIEERSSDLYTVVWDVDVSPFVEKDSIPNVG